MITGSILNTTRSPGFACAMICSCLRELANKAPNKIRVRTSQSLGKEVACRGRVVGLDEGGVGGHGAAPLLERGNHSYWPHPKNCRPRTRYYFCAGFWLIAFIQMILQIDVRVAPGAESAPRHGLSRMPPMAASRPLVGLLSLAHPA